MTGYAYDLAQHKSSRIIEQAARLKAIIWAETLEQPQPRSFSGILVKTDTETLHLQLNQPTLDGTTPMVGQYYQLIISMNDTRYLTVCDLREIQTENSNTFLIFSRPQSLQIMQRRHFHRLTPSQSFPAYVSWQEPEGECEETKKDNIKTVYVRFSLNVRDPEFFTSASICYKELHMEKSELIIGLQFTNTEENGEFQTRLREALNQNIDMKKGN
jgi:hypothetical protein